MPGNDLNPKNLTKLDYVVMPDVPGGGVVSSGSSAFSNPRIRLILLILGGLVVLGSLAFLGFSLLGGSTPEPAIPQIAVNEQNAADAADRDDDNDGLNNAEEQTHDTNRNDSDTDDDGLADGDEVFVYLSDPKLDDTDADTFSDGREVGRGYSPTHNSTSTISADERQTWLANSTKFGLHEPTPTTLRAETQSTTVPTTQPKQIYTNNFYKYSFEYSGDLMLREAQNGQIAALHLSGSEEAEDIGEDTFVARLAGTKDILTLRDWAESQFDMLDFNLTDLTINGVPALRIQEKNTSDCPQDMTFISKQNIIIGVTWNCSNVQQFETYYLDIVNSFIFLR